MTNIEWSFNGCIVLYSLCVALLLLLSFFPSLFLWNLAYLIRCYIFSQLQQKLLMPYPLYFLSGLDATLFRSNLVLIIYKAKFYAFYALLSSHIFLKWFQSLNSKLMICRRKIPSLILQNWDNIGHQLRLHNVKSSWIKLLKERINFYLLLEASGVAVFGHS